MVNTFEVFGSSMEEFPGKKGMTKTLKVIMTDSSSPPMAQFFELGLPPETTPPEKGTRLTIQVGEFSAVFAGRARIRGTIIPTPRK
jgi:hypothetical protein